MRVILSRKGFDSSYGGTPSPILPDGRMISLPIPAREGPISYAEIRRDELNLGDLVEDLTSGAIPKWYRAHHDPDVYADSVARPEGWRPLFGQVEAALSHLHKEGVSPGDLFLFFGWYRRVEYVSGRWRYVRGSPDIHAIWGWLKIGAIHSCTRLPADIKRWAAGHPHLNRSWPGGNDVFISAADHVVADRRLPGAGIFTERRERVLTLPGSPKRSLWELPGWMHPNRGVARISYHEKLSRWSARGPDTCELSTVGRGQEFVLNTPRSDLVEAWLGQLFADV